MAAPTIKDVAKKANVSIATVSLVIHNHERITPETRSRVNKAIEELNYHPSRSARGLASKKTGNIGFIVTEDHFLRSEPFYTRIFLGTEFEARHDEYYILLTTIPSDYDVEDKLPRFILERNVDGVIIAGKIPGLLIESLKPYNIPLVFVDYYPPDENYPVVLIDNISGGMLATDHLIKLGHKKIAFIAGDIQHPSINERFIGYKNSLEKASIEFDRNLAVTDENYPARENGYYAVQRLVQSGVEFSAVFTCNDAMAIGVMQYLKEHGYKIPGDISLIGFDDVEADLSLDPPLSTISVPKIDMGAEVMKLMVSMLKNKVDKPKKVLVPVELVIRNSTGQH